MNDLNQPFDALFIHQPRLQSKAGRNAYRLLTLLAWSAYLYLWLPIATLTMWWLSTRLGYSELQHYPGFIDVDLFLLLLKALGIASLLLLTWAEYNRIRFQGHDRRTHLLATTPESTAAAMGVDLVLAGNLQLARQITVVTDPQAVPIALRGGDKRQRNLHPSDAQRSTGSLNTPALETLDS
ncbi:MAG: poly-beta-1,6-N-acetyl-D-glucosamine biosynthesis protein PgaD [Thermomonas sp.]